jgi:hypothetical protein
MDVVKAFKKIMLRHVKSIIRKALKNVTLNLDDKFCDGDELKK